MVKFSEQPDNSKSGKGAMKQIPQTPQTPPPQKKEEKKKKPREESWEDNTEDKENDEEIEERIDKENQTGDKASAEREKQRNEAAEEFAKKNLERGQLWVHPGGDKIFIMNERTDLYGTTPVRMLKYVFLDENNNEIPDLPPEWFRATTLAHQILDDKYKRQEEVTVEEVQEEVAKEPEKTRLKEAKLKVSGKTLTVKVGQELFGKNNTSITFIDMYKDGDEIVIEADFDNGKSKNPEELEGTPEDIAYLIQKHTLFSGSPERKGATPEKKKTRKEVPYSILGSNYTYGKTIPKDSQEGKLISELLKKKYPKGQKFTFAGILKNRKSPGFWVKDEQGNSQAISSELLVKVQKRIEEVQNRQKESAERLKELPLALPDKRSFTLRKEDTFNLGAKAKMVVRVEKILDNNKGASCTLLSSEGKILMAAKDYSQDQLVNMFAKYPDTKKEKPPYHSKSPEVENLSKKDLETIKKVILDPKNLEVVTHGDIYSYSEWNDIKSARELVGKTIPVDGKIKSQYFVKEVNAKGEVVVIDQATKKEIKYPSDHAFVQNLLLKPKTDLDAMVAIDLLSKVTDNKFSQVAFVHKGESVEQAIGLHPDKNVMVFDTTGIHGVKVIYRKNGTVVIIVDHHAPGLRKPTSVAKMFGEVLKKTELIEGNKELRSITNLVTDTDNLNYPLTRDYVENYWHETMYGLCHKANPKGLPYWFIKEQFAKGRDPMMPFTLQEARGLFLKKQNAEGKQFLIRSLKEAQSFGAAELKKHRAKVELLFDLRRQRRELPKGSEPRKKLSARIKEIEQYLKENYTLEDVMRETRVRTFRSLKKGIPDAEAEMKEHGMKNQTPELGKVLVNLIPKRYNTIPADFPAVAAMGYNSYITLRQDGGALFLSSNFNKKEGVKKVAELLQKELPGMVVIRGLMIGYFPKRWEDKDTDFNKILKLLKIGGEAFPPKEEKEGEVRETLTPGQVRALDIGNTIVVDGKILPIVAKNVSGLELFNGSKIMWAGLERRAGKKELFLLKKTGGAKVETTSPAPARTEAKTGVTTETKVESKTSEVEVPEKFVKSLLKEGVTVIIKGEKVKISKVDAKGIEANNGTKKYMYTALEREAKAGKLKLVKTS